MALIAHYPLNGDTKDYSGYGNDGSIEGTVANILVSEAGKIGKCYETTEVNGGGYIQSDREINLGTTQSMFAWVNIEALSSKFSLNGLVNQHRINGNSAANPPSGMGITAAYLSADNYKVSCSTSDKNGARTYNTYRGETVLNTSRWYHLGYTYDSASGLLKFYVNGSLDGTHPLDFDMNVVTDTIRIFGWNDSSSYQGKQKLNDVRIYDHALSDKEVKEIAKAKVLHYKFDEQDLTTKIVKDCSGFGNDGTVAVATAPTWSEDSPVGRGSMEFGGSAFIETTNGLSIGKNPFTVNSWFKPQGLTTYSHIFTASNQSDFTCKVGVLPNSAPYFYVVGAVNTGLPPKIPRLEVGNWYMLTYTYDGESVGIFINAVLVNTVTPSVKLDIPTTKFRVQNWAHEYGKGLQSDLRVYTTALTPEDILELYQTRASVDNEGNLFVQEIDEISDTSKEVDSRGIARFKEFNEVGGENKMSIKNDGVVYVNEIMEA